MTRLAALIAIGAILCSSPPRVALEMSATAFVLWFAFGELPDNGET